MNDSTEHPPIVAFIEARLSEDERIAHAAAAVDDEGASWQVRKIRDDGMYVFGDHQVAPPGGKLGMAEDGQTEHIAHHDPARVLRQCAGIREMLDYLVGLATDYQDDWDSVIENGGRWLPTSGHYNVYPALERLAATWSTHPDFRPGWAPTEEDPS